MILPVIVEVTQSNGDKQMIQLPVEIWHGSGTWTFKVPTTKKLGKVILDPDKVMPDMDRKNNEWNGK
jgi:hypothetical protein